MAEPRSRSSRKRAKAKVVARQPAPAQAQEPVEAPSAPGDAMVTSALSDPNGWLAIVLATGGLAFVTFLTVLLAVAASRA